MNNLPLVSAIMPTRNRPRLAARAIEHFRRQDYPNKQLIVVSDHEDDIETTRLGLNVFGIVAPGTIGQKRNQAISFGVGDLIIHWDDDDWHAPNRISRQVAALGNADLCGFATLLYYDQVTGEAWHYLGPGTHERWLAGGSLLYRRSLWEQHPFGNISVGEDVSFVDACADAQVVAMDGTRLYVAMTHGGNTSPRKQSWGGIWDPLIPPDHIRGLLGPDDWAFYSGESAEGGKAPSSFGTRPGQTGERPPHRRQLPLHICGSDAEHLHGDVPIQLM